MFLDQTSKSSNCPERAHIGSHPRAATAVPSEVRGCGRWSFSRCRWSQIAVCGRSRVGGSCAELGGVERPARSGSSAKELLCPAASLGQAAIGPCAVDLDLIDVPHNREEMPAVALDALHPVLACDAEPPE